MTDGDLLQRIARILREEIGPAVDDEYPRTQAFMAAVVLQKVSRHLALAGEHAAAETADLTGLLADLRARLADGEAPASVREALDNLTRTRDHADLCRLIEALYAVRPVLGEARFTAVLGRIRQTLRRSIERRMQVAG